MLKIYSSLLLLLLTTNASDVGPRLELVQVVFRHGERVPYSWETYPKDPYAASYDEDPGQLTELGRWRMRQLGLVLRRDYYDLLQLDKAKEKNIYAYSMDLNSNKESLRSLLSGVFEAEGEFMPKIRSVPKELDVLMNSRNCSRYRVELDRLRRTTNTLKRLAKYEGLYTYLTQNTGLTFNDISADEQLYRLHDLMESQRSLNLTLPDWCTEGVLSLLEELAFLHYNLESQTVELKRLNGGPLVRRFLEAMTESNQPRFQLYSGEGHNVAAFVRAHGKRYPRVPNYGSAIVVEKWKSERVFVRILIWTGVTEKLFPLQLKGCPSMCPFEDYKRIVDEVQPSDREVDCLIEDLKMRIIR